MPQSTVTLKQVHRALSASGWRDVPPATFDQWLAQHDAAAASKAYDEAVAMCCEFLGVPNINWPNPYRVETADDQITSATRARVEIPGADLDHATAMVLNAAIDVHLGFLRLQVEGGTITTSANLHKAQEALHEAVSGYLPLVTS
jgi:hypothetical protein